MNNTQKMLQAIINGQSAIQQELLSKVDKVDQKVDRLGERVAGLDGKIDGVEKNLTQRLDKIGRQLAYLEEDTPTRDDFDDINLYVFSSCKVERIKVALPELT